MARHLEVTTIRVVVVPILSHSNKTTVVVDMVAEITTEAVDTIPEVAVVEEEVDGAVAEEVGAVEATMAEIITTKMIGIERDQGTTMVKAEVEDGEDSAIFVHTSRRQKTQARVSFRSRVP